MYAVIKSGGKQYLVKKGDEVKLEKLDKKAGVEVKFDALLVFDKDGKKVEVGKPKIDKVKVVGKVLEEGRSKKVSVIKYKRKTRYRKNVGHRQCFTKVKISSIGA